MTVIEIETLIEGDINRCFDLTRDIDVHKRSTEDTNEIVIAGRTRGLCELGDQITWEAKHFGIRQQLSVEITKFHRPYFFEDRMMMTDKFEYQVPFGFAGRVFDKIILKRYMTKFLRKRNTVIKKIAEQHR
jgi:hypothetical protein